MISLNTKTGFILKKKQNRVIKKLVKEKNKIEKYRNTFYQNKKKVYNYEFEQKSFFINRCAIKLAEIDYIFEIIPKDNDKMFFFADVCGGPGGFVEYIFYKKNWYAKGFGITLKNKNDYVNFEILQNMHKNYFEKYYGPNKNDDGDIYNNEILLGYIDFVLQKTDFIGVDLMIADGGFDIKNYNEQETLSKRLYLCQCIIALKIVKNGGNFICKFFDMFSNFSIQLFSIISNFFYKVYVYKPKTSRSINSERYVIFKNKKSDNIDNIFDLLLKNNNENVNVKNSSIENIENIKIKKYKILRNNIRIGKEQIFNFKNFFKELLKFNLDDNIIKWEQKEKHELNCLDIWNLPRTKNIYEDNNNYLDYIFRSHKIIFSPPSPELKNISDFLFKIFNPEEWFYTKVNKRTKKLILLCDEKNNFIVWDTKLKQYCNIYQNLYIPRNTIIFVEICKLKIRILDGFYLGNQYIGNCSFFERQKLCKIFVQSLNTIQEQIKSNNIYYKYYLFEPVVFENILKNNDSSYKLVVQDLEKISFYNNYSSSFYIEDNLNFEFDN